MATSVATHRTIFFKFCLCVIVVVSILVLLLDLDVLNISVPTAAKTSKRNSRMKTPRVDDEFVEALIQENNIPQETELISTQMEINTKQTEALEPLVQRRKQEELSFAETNTEEESQQVLNVSSSPPLMRPNIIFLMADDLRPQLGPYWDKSPGWPKTHTPNFDRLASKSLVLKSAFAQYSLCGPSRTSLLTSRRPDTTHVFDNDHYWRNEGGNFVTLPQYFKNHGYRTIGIGKVFHRGSSSNNNDPISWSDKYARVKHTDGLYLPSEGEGAWWKSVSPTEEKEIPLMDTVATQIAKNYLAELNKSSPHTPFFLALGFKKPHLSIICPEKFYNMYETETEEIFLANDTWQRPYVRPGCNLRNAHSETGFKFKLLPDTELRYFRRAYFACISYVDFLLGEILDAVDHYGLTQSTIITFMADHGYHLGENKYFGKSTAYDMSTHVPMMIHVPGKTDQGISSSSVVEALDMFPTLVEAAGLPTVPKCPDDSSSVDVCVQGTSLYPLIEDSDSAIKEAALSQVRYGLNFMKYGVRTKDYRFVQVAKLEHVNGKSRIAEFLETDPDPEYNPELYDHRFDDREMYNVINEQNYTDVRESMQRLIQRLTQS